MDTVFFIAAKVVGYLIKVETWLLLLLIFTLIAVWRDQRKKALRRGFFTLFFLLILGSQPIGEALLQPLEKAFPPRPAPENLDGIIILAGVESLRASGYWGTPQLNEAAERLTGGAELALKNPDAQIIFAGGSGALSRAFRPGVGLPSTAPELLMSLGIDGERITWERRSRNTAENAALTLELLGGPPEGNWALVTSAFHMGRALQSFEAAGWGPLTPYPVDHRTGPLGISLSWGLSTKLLRLNGAIKEHAGRLAYRLFGR